MTKLIEFEEEIQFIDQKSTFSSKIDKFPNEKTVFRVEKENYILKPEVFKTLFPYISLINHTFIENSNKIYILPKTIDKSSFEQFLNMIDNAYEYNLNLVKSKKVLNIAEFFNFTPLIDSIINNTLFHLLDKSTCLSIINDYTKKLYNPSIKNSYIPLIHKAVEVAVNNIFYLINNKYNELLALDSDPLEEIVENYFESALFSMNIDNIIIMKLLIKSRRLDDIFDLLEDERRRSIEIFNKQNTEINSIEPSIIWNISCDNPISGFYKESEEFLYENISLVLINYYDSVKDSCTIAVKIKDIQSNDLKINEKNQFIISLLSICEIKEIKLKTRINFNCIYSHLRSKVLICKIENFSEKFMSFEKINYNLSIFFSISYNFSMILTHICRYFYEYYSLSSIFKISKNVFSIIVKYEYLNIRSEDELLEAVKNWIFSKKNEHVNDIFKNIKWKLLSLDVFLEFILNESKLILAYQDLQYEIINEFQRRCREDLMNSNLDNDENDFSNQRHSLNKLSCDHNNYNVNSSQNVTEVVKKSFISDFILKLISK